MTAADIEGREFLSTAVEGRTLVDGTQIRLSFGTDGTLSAAAGCNTMFGSFDLDGNELVVGTLGSTEMGCDPDRHAQDDWLAALLAGRPAISVDGDELALTAGAVTVTLLDREVAEPDRPLEGTHWVVDSVIDADAVSSVPAGLTAYLDFADGRVSGHTGCNSLSGDYELVDGGLRFGEIATTLMACESDLDAMYQVVSAGTVTVEIDGNRLDLRTDAGLGLGFSAED